jgi:choline kinase
MKCLIIAAGRGSRLQLRGNSKPLIPIFGIPLIERVIRSALDAGVDDFYVVTGYQQEHVTSFLHDLSHRINVSITPIYNEDWQKENGVSVLKAREYLQEPFLLLMSDHIFDPNTLRELMEVPLPRGEIILAVDRAIDNPTVNLDDVTRVKIKNGKISEIGKGLADYNGFDTGIFMCTPAIFEALEQSAEKNDNTSLSGGVYILASQGRVNATAFTGQFWIDVDDPVAMRQAENILLNYLPENL